MTRKKTKPYWEMNTGELADATKHFDKEFVPTWPLSKKIKRSFNKAKKKIGRPRIGKGARRVLITIERTLLRQSDAYARRKKMSRSQLIASSLRALLSTS